MSELSPKERLVLSLRHGVTDNVPKRLDELADVPQSSAREHRGRARQPRRQSLRAAVDHAERARATAALHESELEGVVAILVRARRSRRRDDAADRRRRACRCCESLKQQGAVQKAVEALPIEEKTILQAPLRRPAGRRADAARHRRDPRPLARARAADRVARRGEVPAQRRRR